MGRQTLYLLSQPPPQHVASPVLRTSVESKVYIDRCNGQTPRNPQPVQYIRDVPKKSTLKYVQMLHAPVMSHTLSPRLIPQQYSRLPHSTPFVDEALHIPLRDPPQIDNDVVGERPDLRLLVSAPKDGTRRVRGPNRRPITIFIPEIHFVHGIVAIRERHHRKELEHTGREKLRCQHALTFVPSHPLEPPCR
jgi:hypothetical protein